MSMKKPLGNSIGKNLKKELDELDDIKFIITPKDTEYIFETNIGRLKYVNNGFGTLYIFNEDKNIYEIYPNSIDLSYDNLLKD